MLKAEQVPKEAADAMWKLVSEGGFTSAEDAIAAAINSWPGIIVGNSLFDGEPMAFLPLPQEPRDE